MNYTTTTAEDKEMPKNIDEGKTWQNTIILEKPNGYEISSKRKLIWSIITIFCVAITTGYGSQVKFSLLNDDPGHFYPPFTMMWFNNCCLLICFPAYVLYEKINGKGMSFREIWLKSATIFSPSGFKWGQFLAKECLFLLLYTVGNYSYALSLGKITSSAALTIRSLEVSLVYVLSRFVLKEKFYLLKTLAVFLAMAGVILIALDKQFAANLLGIVLILLCCCVDTLYKISFKWMAYNAKLGEAMLFLSGMAIVNLPLNFIPTALLNYYDVEVWQWYHVPWGNLANFIFLTFVFNIATIFGTAFLSPLIISIGVLCGIPISIGMDVVLRGRQLQLGFVLGAISLLISVILVNFHQQIRRLFSRKNLSENADDEKPAKMAASDENKIEENFQENNSNLPSFTPQIKISLVNE